MQVWVEWMTFWAFALAGGLSLLALAREASLEHPLRTLYLAAFALGLVLFIITLALNVIALLIVRKYRERYE